MHRLRTLLFTFALSSSGFVLHAPNAEAKDTSIKGGLIFHPSEAPLSNRWLVTFAMDVPLNVRETLFWGIEFQGASYNVDEGGGTTQIIPANGFLNFRYKADKFSFRPYVGAGLGMMTYFSLHDGENEWTRHAGVHFQAGLEIHPFVLELSGQRAFTEATQFNWLFLAGLVF